MKDRAIRVLLVEDDRDFVQLVRGILERERAFQIEHRDTLAGSLERLKQGPLDVLLVDLGLSDSKGLQTFTRLSAAAPAIPIVVLSVTDDQTIALEAVRQGAQDYLVKTDTDLKLIPRILRYAIARRRTDAALREVDRLEQLNRMLMEREGRVLDL